MAFTYIPDTIKCICPGIIYVGLYGTSLSPIITQTMYIYELPFGIRLLFSLLIGIVIGFVLPPLSTHVHYAHKGYSLYNVGFAAGIIATVVVSVMKSFGLETESRLLWDTGHDAEMLFVLSGLFLIMAAGARLVGGKEVIEGYKKILKYPGISGTDYLVDEGGTGYGIQYGGQRLVRDASCPDRRRGS